MAGKSGRTDAENRWIGTRIRLGLITGSSGPAGPPGQTREVWRGAWADSTDYHKGDLVYRDHGLGNGLVRTYISTEDHTSAGDGPMPGGTTYWHEFNVSDLIIDGSRAMVGNLNMNHHDIDNAVDVEVESDIVMNGPVGEARIASPRVITMTGAEADSEARIEAVKALAFDEVSPTPEYGRTAFDLTEGVFSAFVRSGSGLVLVALGWGVLQARLPTNTVVVSVPLLGGPWTISLWVDGVFWASADLTVVGGGEVLTFEGVPAGDVYATGIIEGYSSTSSTETLADGATVYLTMPLSGG